MYHVPKTPYVSFDVFDTLIWRSVAKPSDLFLHMEQYCRSRGLNIPEAFTEKRMEAGQRAHKKVAGHATLSMIYDELRAELGPNTDELMSLELQMELDGCNANPVCAEWLRQCVLENKTVVLISDMYLSAAVIKHMLEKCGIEGYKKLYVSCECGAKKRDGTLFRHVLNDLAIRPDQLTHIGDSRKSDLLIPFSMGIRTHWIQNDIKALCKAPKELAPSSAFAYRTLQAATRNCSAKLSGYEKMGCEVFGPVLYGFSQWLYKRLCRDDIHDVYFMARDGYVMKRAFDELATKGIKTHYLLASRRAYFVPTIWFRSEFEEVIQWFSHVNRMSLRSFLLRIGLDPEPYQKKAREFNLELDRVYEKRSFYQTPAVKSFYDAIRADVIENSKAEYDALCSYLDSLHMDRRIAIVDIGYLGTMQHALEQILRQEDRGREVKGYYLCVHPTAERIRRGDIKAEGYLYNLDANKDNYSIVQPVLTLFEIQFLEPHGSFKRFVFRNGEAVADFEEFEYKKSNEQKVDEESVINDYQNGAVMFVHYMKEAFPHTFELPPDASLYAFKQVSLAPSLREAELWGDFRFLDFTIKYMARPQPLTVYIRHPQLLRKDFMLSEWKIGFMKRFLRIPLPYYKIYLGLKKIYMAEK